MTSQELFQTILESDLQISNPTVVFSEVSQSTDTGTLMLEAFNLNFLGFITPLRGGMSLEGR